MPKLSIALVNWNTTQLTKDCLLSIVENTSDLDYEVIIIDNGSTDGGIDSIIQDSHRAKLIKNERNLGLAAATNQAFEVAQGEYFLLLNPDTIVHKYALQKMVGFLDNCSNAGAVTCKLKNADGSTQYNMHRRFPSFLRLVFGYLYKLNPRFKTKWAREYLMLDCKYDKDEKIDQAGTCIMVKKKIIEDMGEFFDARRFPLFFNDVDLCYRLHKNNFDLYVVNDAVITHLIGQSVKKLNAYLIKKEHAISNLSFYKKHKLYIDYFLTKIAFLVRYSFMALYSFGLLLFRKTDWTSFKGWLSVPISVLLDRKITL
jgi:N-acetylglucosaminyl-diphospho-decaprenol L-rhamnosyltransferase